MKVRIYSDTTFPEGMAKTHRIVCYAKGLKAAGADVCYVGTHRLVERENSFNYKCSGVYEGIPYTYSSGLLKRKNKLLRGLDWILFDAVRTFFYALKNIRSGDVVYVYTESLSIQLAIILASRYNHAKILHECCEHPYVMVDMTKTWNKVLRSFELRYMMPCYDGFISISHELEMFCNSHKAENAKVLTVPILVDDDSFIDYSNMQNPCKDMPYILHTGTMFERKDGISMQLEAFAELKKQNPEIQCKFIFAGPQSNEKCAFIPKMKELGIYDDIVLAGMLSTYEVKRYQHFCTVGIIYRFDNLQNRCGFSTKSGEMLMSGHPIIITTVGDGKEYLKNGESAFILEPNDKQALIDSLTYIFTHPREAEEIGQKGRRIAQTKFNPIEQGKIMYDFIKTIQQ